MSKIKLWESKQHRKTMQKKTYFLFHSICKRSIALRVSCEKNAQVRLSTFCFETFAICCFVFLFFCISQHWGLAVKLPLVGMLLRLCKPPQVPHMMLIWSMHLFCYIMYLDTGSGMKSWALTYSLGTICVSLVSLFLDSKAHDSWLWHKTNRSFRMIFCN